MWKCIFNWIDQRVDALILNNYCTKMSTNGNINSLNMFPESMYDKLSLKCLSQVAHNKLTSVKRHRYFAGFAQIGREVRKLTP